MFLPNKVELVYFNQNFCEEPDKAVGYFANFESATQEQKWIGEKTPRYFWSSKANYFENQPPTSHNPNIPQSVAHILSNDLQLIVSLRHPVLRAISAYGHHGQRKRIKKDEYLTDVVANFGIGDIGFYDKHLEAWEDVFEPSQITSLVFESDIALYPDDGLKILCQSLSIDQSGFRNLSFEPSNKGSDRKIFG